MLVVRKNIFYLTRAHQTHLSVRPKESRASPPFLTSLSACDPPSSQHSNCCGLSNSSSCQIVLGSLSSSEIVQSAWGQMLLAVPRMTHWDNVDRHQSPHIHNNTEIRRGMWSCCGGPWAALGLPYLFLFDNLWDYLLFFVFFVLSTFPACPTLESVIIKKNRIVLLDGGIIHFHSLYLREHHWVEIGYSISFYNSSFRLC